MYVSSFFSNLGEQIIHLKEVVINSREQVTHLHICISEFYDEETRTPTDKQMHAHD